jgi:hypothetical protein
MNWTNWLLSGFVATLVLSALLATSQGIGLTRMNLPYLIGVVITHDRDKALLYGFCLHVVNGYAFSVLYVLIFESAHFATWWFGSLIGLIHALFVLTVGMMLLPTPAYGQRATRAGFTPPVGASRVHGAEPWLPDTCFCHTLLLARSLALFIGCTDSFVFFGPSSRPTPSSKSPAMAARVFIVSPFGPR